MIHLKGLQELADVIARSLSAMAIKESKSLMMENINIMPIFKNRKTRELDVGQSRLRPWKHLGAHPLGVISNPLKDKYQSGLVCTDV